jgi:hypothetical protein
MNAEESRHRGHRHVHAVLDAASASTCRFHVNSGSDGKQKHGDNGPDYITLAKEAQSTLARDGSFLEALQALKWEVDRDARVKAAMHGLRDRGLSVFTSFVPRIRIRLHAGDTVLALPKDGAKSSRPDVLDLGPVRSMTNEPLTQELRDAASAVLTDSPHCRHLDGIVNEAVQANSVFERLAAAVERAGYELQICLDLSTYTQVREQSSSGAQMPGHQVPQTENQSSQMNSGVLLLSDLDEQFLKAMRISPD